VSVPAIAETGTIGSALRWGRSQLHAAGIGCGDIEAELLMRHALGLSREAMLARLRERLNEESLGKFESLLARRLAHEPTPYITGRCDFYGLDLECSPAALIPRPETELLVELTLDWVARRGSRIAGLRIADVGTGNGAIAVAIGTNGPRVSITATDVSHDALKLGRSNARRHGAEECISFVQGDLLSSVRGPFDVIAANLPYIPTVLRETLAPEILGHEPPAALFAGERGTELIEHLVFQACDVLAPGGLLLAEHAWDQGERLREAARHSFPDARVETKRDLAGLERTLVVEDLA
jgi:release factor glutamine methyltransferase